MRQHTLFIDADSIITTRPSGIGSMTVQLIRALSEDASFTEHYRLILLTPFNKVGLLEQWRFNEHVAVRKLPLTGRMIALLVKLRLMPPVDLVVGRGTYLFPNFRRLPLLFSKSVTYIHDVSFRVYPEFVEKKNLNFLTAHVGEWIRKSDIVVTVSEHAKQEIVHFYPDAASKVATVYNGINDSFQPLGEAEVKPTLDEYRLAYKNYFIFLSNLEPRKNILGLLAAYRHFIEDPEHQAVKLLLVGGMGWNNEAILAEIAAINTEKTRVIVPAHYVPDAALPALLSGAAALVHPAHYEGFGISPLQAMACGTQVVVANNTSLPEVVGEAGIYVDDKNTEAIESGMQVAYNERYTVNTNGIERAKQFTWRRSAKQLATIITELEDT